MGELLYKQTIVSFYLFVYFLCTQVIKFPLAQILFFCELKPNAKFQNPTINPSGRKVTQGEEEEEREKTPLIVDTYLRDSARKPLGPIQLLKQQDSMDV